MKKKAPKLSRRTLKKVVKTSRFISWFCFIAAVLLTRMDLTFENFMMNRYTAFHQLCFLHTESRCKDPNRTFKYRRRERLSVVVCATHSLVAWRTLSRLLFVSLSFLKTLLWFVPNTNHLKNPNGGRY